MFVVWWLYVDLIFAFTAVCGNETYNENMELCCQLTVVKKPESVLNAQCCGKGEQSWNKNPETLHFSQTKQHFKEVCIKVSWWKAVLFQKLTL